MKPRPFKFHNPLTLQQAREVAAENEDDFMFYAGGTEAVIGLKERVLFASHVINLKRIPNLAGIKHEDGALHIGPLVTHQQLADSALVQRLLPGYAALSNNVANIRVRSAGTLAGNLCFAEPNADPPPMLAALDARVVLSSGDGEREVPVREFFEGEYSTVREDHEIMTAIVIPVDEEKCKSAYRKMVYLNRPSAGVAAVRIQEMDGPRWEVWAGSITGKPERLDGLCEGLAGKEDMDESVLIEAARQDLVGIEIMDGLYGTADYRKQLVAVLAARSVKECLQ